MYLKTYIQNNRYCGGGGCICSRIPERFPEGVPCIYCTWYVYVQHMHMPMCSSRAVHGGRVVHAYFLHSFEE